MDGFMIIAIIAKMKPALSTIQLFDFLPSSILHPGAQVTPGCSSVTIGEGDGET